MAAVKLSIAMATGNTCVLKPPSIDSLSALKLAEFIAELDIPAGVVNVITGPGGTVGEALASHKDVDLVAFTGSCSTGKRIMELASRTVKRVQLELGGKNPVIVMDDADIDTAAAASVSSQYYNVGQICASPGRFYIHEKVHDEFLEKFVSRAKKLIVGDPNDMKTQIGPVVSAEHRGSVESFIESGIKEGARLVLGGKRPVEPPLNRGYFVTPTVFAGVKQTMTISREEIFGPVACFMEPFSSEEEVIDLANDNIFGLAASVWTKDVARGIRMAEKLCAGTVTINKAFMLEPQVPWGGIKESGFGKDSSKYGLEDFTQLKVISLDTNK
jgi:acyl-CoA reductase-like NAD-dependent aldehyde dehydrogenase